MKKIVIDLLGGDNPQQTLLRGVIDASKDYGNFSFVLVGDEKIIREELKNSNVSSERFEIIDASISADKYQNPLVFVREDTDSSLTKCFNELKTDLDTVGLISAGPTGCLLLGSCFKLGLVKGLKFPCLLSLLPMINGQKIALCDCGANVDCSPQLLVSFAKMSEIFMKSYLNREDIRVALLNVGKESSKGNKLAKETYPLLEQSGLNFVGNMEGNDIYFNKADVIVTDGYSGNLLLKSTESVAIICREIGANYLENEKKISFIKELDEFFNYNQEGGAHLVGAIKPIVKAHGRATSRTIYCCIRDLIKLSENSYIDRLEKEIKD